MPANVTELRCFIGMTNQLGKFSKNLGANTATPPTVEQKLDMALGSRTGSCLYRSEGRADQTYNSLPLQPTSPHQSERRCLILSYGLGAVILQRNGKPIAYASLSMTENEIRYAQIEKEALATTWACERFSTYILGKIETDHKPLVPLLGAKELNNLPPRILRFRLRLARFDYSISHVPGKMLHTADALSRAPSMNSVNDTELQQDAETLLNILKIWDTRGRRQ